MAPTHSTRFGAILITVIFACLLFHGLTVASASQEPSEGLSPRQQQDEARPTNGRLPSTTLMFLGAGFGFLVGFLRLLKQFYRFIGLGIIANWYSGLFLGLVALSSGASYLALAKAVEFSKGFLTNDGMLWLVLDKGQSLFPIIGGSMLGNGFTILGRLFRRSRLDTGAFTQVRDLRELKSNNVLFHLICEPILDGMDKAVIQMARLYDWGLIKETVSRLVESEITLGRIEPKEGEEAVKYMLAAKTSTDPSIDFNNKYSTLMRAIKVSSFRQLRSRLARGTK
jgi:hypothetical protein